MRSLETSADFQDPELLHCLLAAQDQNRTDRCNNDGYNWGVETTRGDVEETLEQQWGMQDGFRIFNLEEVTDIEDIPGDEEIPEDELN